MGARGMLYYHGSDDRLMLALDVPGDQIVDTNGAGDIFHGAYVYAYLTNPGGTWTEHFRFARAASAHAIQHLGNEASLPTLADIKETHARFGERRETLSLTLAK
jgi:sulfofructose kinase